RDLGRELLHLLIRLRGGVRLLAGVLRGPVSHRLLVSVGRLLAAVQVVVLAGAEVGLVLLHYLHRLAGAALLLAAERSERRGSQESDRDLLHRYLQLVSCASVVMHPARRAKETTMNFDETDHPFVVERRQSYPDDDNCVRERATASPASTQSC